MIDRLRPLVPAGLLVAALPIGRWGAAAAGEFGSHPAVVFVSLAAGAVGFGAAAAVAVRPAVGRARRGETRHPVTAVRTRLAVSVGVAASAGLAGWSFSDELGVRWSVRERSALPETVVLKGRGGADLHIPKAQYLMTRSPREPAADAYVRGWAFRHGFPLPARLTLAVARAFPVFAAALAAATVWRFTGSPVSRAGAAR